MASGRIKVNGKLLGLISETAVHVGIGQMDGAVDLPIAREGASNIPFAPGSGVKGALLETAKERGLKQIDKIFGGDSNESSENKGSAGSVLFGDMRLLLLPVRSLNGFFKWVTCPYLIERYFRDLDRVTGASGCDIPTVGDHKVVCQGKGPIYLEERLFTVEDSGKVSGHFEALVSKLQSVIPCNNSENSLEERLAIVSNADFAWFAEHAIPVVARNVLQDDEQTRKENNNIPTKKSKNLWYEEHLPPDTIMTLALVNRSSGDDVNSLVAGLFCEGKQAAPYFRLGGNETTGQGWFKVGAISEPNEEAS